MRLLSIRIELFYFYDNLVASCCGFQPSAIVLLSGPLTHYQGRVFVCSNQRAYLGVDTDGINQYQVKI